MLKLSASLAACASSYAVYVLQESADYEAGNVTVNYSLCAVFALLTGTLTVLAVPAIKKASIALNVFNGIVLFLSVVTAVASWSIPNSGATDVLAIVITTFTVPLLGIFSVAAVGLALVGLVLDFKSWKRDR